MSADVLHALGGRSSVFAQWTHCGLPSWYDRAAYVLAYSEVTARCWDSSYNNKVARDLRDVTCLWCLTGRASW